MDITTVAIAPDEKFDFVWGTFRIPTDQPLGTIIKAEVLNFQIFFTDTIFSSLGPVMKSDIFDFSNFENRPTITFKLSNATSNSNVSFFDALVFNTTTGAILSSPTETR